jgi:hypothetical protein
MAAIYQKPVVEFVDIRIHGREGFCNIGSLQSSVISVGNGSHYGLFVDIKTTTDRVNKIHGTTSFG